MTSTGGCVKVKVKNSFDEAHAKGCAVTCNATDIPLCREQGTVCKLGCCFSDLCNEGPGFLVNGLILTYSTVLIIIIIIMMIMIMIIMIVIIKK